jgi:hypothetical protein
VHTPSGVGKLPNVTIAHPGEVWSDQRAQGNIVPGAAIIPVNIAGKKGKKQIAAGDAPDRRQVAVALRQVEVPDINPARSTASPSGRTRSSTC